MGSQRQTTLFQKEQEPFFISQFKIFHCLITYNKPNKLTNKTDQKNNKFSNLF